MAVILNMWWLYLLFCSFLLLLATDEVSKLGDSQTSDLSRDVFFAELDNNGNGNITIDELLGFIEDTGGKSLDDEKEIQHAANNVLRSLDVEGSGEGSDIIRLDDLTKYWSSIASLLSVDEVASWAEHAQHMPSDVVRRFLESKITGYDFPELLANDGALLESELGITRATTKTRIMRGMRMKLLGMGQLPEAVKDAHVESLPCGRLLIRWRDEPSTTAAASSATSEFPVHKYVVHRYDALGSASNSGLTSAAFPSTAATSSSSAPPTWRLVYEGMELTYTDSALSAGSSYLYRVASWNAIGHSEYVILSASTPPASRWSSDCTPIDAAQAVAAHAYNIASSRSEEARNKRGLLMASVVSAYNAALSTFLAVKYVLYALMFLTTLYTSIGRMWRYKSAVKKRFPLLAAVLEYISSVLSVWFPAEGALLSAMAALQSSIGKRVLQTSEYIQSSVNAFLSVNDNSPISTGNSRPARMGGLTSSASNNRLASKRVGPNGYATTREASVRSLISTSNTSGNDENEYNAAYSADEDDYGTCSICTKKFKFKLSRWRKRHHCCQCSNVFCGDCGVITHANFLQCKVPGSCRCNNCVIVLQCNVNDEQHETESCSPSILSNRRAVSASCATGHSNSSIGGHLDAVAESTRGSDNAAAAPPEMKRQRSVSALWSSLSYGGGKRLRRHSATENKSAAQLSSEK